jgi:hypothetical protein
MGEKGNLLDTSEEVFANLAEQGPQFWSAYEQYKLARGKGIPTPTAADEAGAQDLTAEEFRRPATE